ncbi:hypothetical protein niasHT_006682 [Heterodera trifolii]|uniref:Uncharacterized protein n=1 Tax=Heterodera trifolii TaxID=157864 RepID=A0ABD2M9Z5_9BILA
MSNQDNSNGQQPYHLSSASANDNSQHFTTAFKMGIVARRLLKNRAIQKQLERRQKNMKTLRRQQAAAAALSSIIVHSAGIGLPRTDPRQEICTVPSHEVIYDVPFDAQREEEEDEDSF